MSNLELIKSNEFVKISHNPYDNPNYKDYIYCHIKHVVEYDDEIGVQTYNAYYYKTTLSLTDSCTIIICAANDIIYEEYDILETQEVTVLTEEEYNEVTNKIHLILNAAKHRLNEL